MEKKVGDGCGFSGEENPETASLRQHDEVAIDHFYEKLGKLNESSGLSLLFDLRETMLDLHSFYQEVMKRGGFYQVTKFGKWADVASASNLKSYVSMSSAQLQNIYEILLLQYELMYCCKMPEKAVPWPHKTSFMGREVSQSYSTGKRKHCDRDDNCQLATGIECAGAETMNKNSTIIPTSNSNIKESEMKLDAPLKPRTAYHIFLRLEINRLKMIYGESSATQNLREMATDRWRCLSEKDKQPYIEASIMDKERYDKEMATYDKQIGELLKNDVYRVSLEDYTEEALSPDESVVELAIEEMKNAQSNNDPIFHVDWDMMPQ